MRGVEGGKTCVLVHTDHHRLLISSQVQSCFAPSAWTQSAARSIGCLQVACLLKALISTCRGGELGGGED